MRLHVVIGDPKCGSLHLELARHVLHINRGPHGHAHGGRLVHWGVGKAILHSLGRFLGFESQLLADRTGAHFRHLRIFEDKLILLRKINILRRNLSGYR